MAMKLPGGETAFIPPEKLTSYLLSETHPLGQPKAHFFRSLGYTVANADVLAQHLLMIAQTADVTAVSTTPHGQKYVVVGSVPAHDGRSVLVQTVWICEPGDARPRLVTAYPAKES